MFRFNETDTYKVSRDSDNFKIDTKVLLRLYEPLIGSTAVSLYLTLDSEFKLLFESRILVDISRLLKLLAISLPEFDRAVELLRIHKLLVIRASRTRKNDYLFKIQLPLSAQTFLKDSQLRENLLKNVGEEYYKQIYHYFITAKIDEDEYVDLSEVLVKEKTPDEFFSALKEKYQPLCHVFTEATKKEILRLKKLYDLDYNAVEVAIFQSVAYEPDPCIDLISFNANIEKMQQATNGKNPDEDRRQKFFNELDTKPVLEYYTSVFKRTLLPSEENSLLAIQKKYDASNGIINAAVWYYQQYANKTIRNYSAKYIEKIVISLMDNHCKNAEDAINYFKDYQQRSREYAQKKEYTSFKKEPIQKENETQSAPVDEALLQEFLKTLED